MVEFYSKCNRFFENCWLARFAIENNLTLEVPPRSIDDLKSIAKWHLRLIRPRDLQAFQSWKSSWGHGIYWLPCSLSSEGLRNAAVLSFKMALPELFFASGCWGEFQQKIAPHFVGTFTDLLISELALGLDHGYLRLLSGLPTDIVSQQQLSRAALREVRDERILPPIAKAVLLDFDPDEILDPRDPDYRWAGISDYWENREYEVVAQQRWCDFCERAGVTFQSFQSEFENREWKEIAYREGLVTVFQPALVAGKDQYGEKQHKHADPAHFIEDWKQIFVRADKLNKPHNEHFKILLDVKQITLPFHEKSWGLGFRGSRYAAAIILAEAGRYEDAIQLMPALEPVPDYYPEVTAGDDLVHRIAVECFLGMDEGLDSLRKILLEGRVARSGRLLYHWIDISTLFECLIRCRNPEVSKLLADTFKRRRCDQEHQYFIDKGAAILGPWQPLRST